MSRAGRPRRASWLRRVAVALAAAPAILLAFAWWLTTQPFVQPLPSQPPAVDAARLREHVRLLSQVLHPRSFDHPAQLAAAGRYVRDALAAAGAQVGEQEVRVDGQRFFNVVARFGPATGAPLVVGAHYDSHGDAGGGTDPDSHTPGADDNASGVAGLIELARLLAQRPPARPVELVAYTLEEPPHFRRDTMGSMRHARSLDPQRPPELMIALEMIGYFSDAEGSQGFPLPGLDWIYPDRGDFVAIVSRWGDWAPTRRLKAAMAGATTLPVRSINAPPALPGIDFSDHLAYWAVGVPAVMVGDTAFHRNREYHLAGDTFDRLDYGRMAKVVQGVYAFVAAPAR